MFLKRLRTAKQLAGQSIYENQAHNNLKSNIMKSRIFADFNETTNNQLAKDIKEFADYFDTPNNGTSGIYISEDAYRELLRIAALIKFNCSVGIVNRVEDEEGVSIRVRQNRRRKN